MEQTSVRIVPSRRSAVFQWSVYPEGIDLNASWPGGATSSFGVGCACQAPSLIAMPRCAGRSSTVLPGLCRAVAVMVIRQGPQPRPHGGMLRWAYLAVKTMSQQPIVAEDR